MGAQCGCGMNWSPWHMCRPDSPAQAPVLAEFQGWDQVALRRVTGPDGSWDVTAFGMPVGRWRRTEHGAVLDDTSGERVVVVTAIGEGTAAVAGCGAHAGAWSDLAHKVLGGKCEIRSW